MYWSEILDNTQGVMILEGIENSRQALPMTDAAGMMTFRKQQKDQMKGIWEIMFPHSAQYHKEEEEKRQAFKGRKDMYKKMADERNRERGIK